MANFTKKMIGTAAVVLATAATANAEWGTNANAGVLLDNSEMNEAETARTSDGGLSRTFGRKGK